MQHENQDDQPTMGENDLRIIATEPRSSDITSAITDDNEHVNGSQELTEEEIKEFIKNEQVAASEDTFNPSKQVRYNESNQWATLSPPSLASLLVRYKDVGKNNLNSSKSRYQLSNTK